MADEPEKSGQEPNLELPPLFGFGRKKKGRQADPAPSDAAPAAPATEELPAADPEPTGDPLAADPVPRPAGPLAPAASKPKRLPPVPPPSARAATPVQPDPEPVPLEAGDPVATQEPVLDPPDEPVESPAPPPVQPPAPPAHTEPVPPPEPVEPPAPVDPPEPVDPPTPPAPPPPVDPALPPVPVEPGPSPTRPPSQPPAPPAHVEPVPPPEPVQPAAPVEPPAPVERPGPVAPPVPVDPPTEAQAQALLADDRLAAEETVLLPVPETTASGATRFSAPAQRSAPDLTTPEWSGTDPDDTGTAAAEDPGTDPAPAASPRRTLRLPRIDARLATAVTGVLVGLLGVTLTVLADRGCEQVRGVGSCGGIGLFALLVILAIEVVLGAALLKLLRVYDPVSTSVLAVVLVAVFVLLFLLGELESVWMFLVIPLISAVAFVLSWWVTETFIESPDGSTG